MSARLNEPVAGLAKVRPMTLADVRDIIEIERSAYPYPWSEGIFRDCVRVGYYCRVVELRGVVQGYGIMSFAADEAHLLNICIHQEIREHGVGRRLLQYLMDHARSIGMRYAYLEVRPSNPVAIYLYESMGFERVGIRKGYYQGSPVREDAWVYKLELTHDVHKQIDEKA